MVDSFHGLFTGAFGPARPGSRRDGRQRLTSLQDGLVVEREGRVHWLVPTQVLLQAMARRAWRPCASTRSSARRPTTAPTLDRVAAEPAEAALL